jgi:hypothetical protein
LKVESLNRYPKKAGTKVPASPVLKVTALSFSFGKEGH